MVDNEKRRKRDTTIRKRRNGNEKKKRLNIEKPCESSKKWIKESRLSSESNDVSNKYNLEIKRQLRPQFRTNDVLTAMAASPMLLRFSHGQFRETL